MHGGEARARYGAGEEWRRQLDEGAEPEAERTWYMPGTLPSVIQLNSVSDRVTGPKTRPRGPRCTLCLSLSRTRLSRFHAGPRTGYGRSEAFSILILFLTARPRPSHFFLVGTHTYRHGTGKLKNHDRTLRLPDHSPLIHAHRTHTSSPTLISAVAFSRLPCPAPPPSSFTLDSHGTPIRHTA